MAVATAGEAATAGTMVVPRPRFTAPTRWLLILAIAVLASLAQARTGRDLVNPGGWPQLARFLRAAAHPDLSPEFLRLVVDAAFTTLAYAVCGIALSLVFAAIGMVLASEWWWRAVLPAGASGGRFAAPWLFVRSVLAAFRAANEYLWGLFFLNIFGLDPLTAVLALAIPYAAIEAKVFSEILDDTPRRPFETVLNGGARPLQAFLYTLLPQAFPDLLAYTFYRLECAIRTAAVLGLIGAGGLGYEILLSLQSLRYEQLWTLFAALFVLNGAVDIWSTALRRRAGGATRMDIAAGRRPARRGPVRLDRLTRTSGILAVGLVAASAVHLQPDLSLLTAERTQRLLGSILADAFPPAIDRDQVAILIRLAWQTLAISLLASTVASTLGIAFAFPAASNALTTGGLLDARPDGAAPPRGGRIVGLAIVIATRGLLLIMRAIPAPVWALLLLFVLFPGILPGALALGLYTAGVLGRLMAEVVEGIDDCPVRALGNAGAPAGLVFLYGLLPLAMPRFVAYALYRWEVCIRETIVVGLVGAGGLGVLLSEQLSSFDFSAVTATLVAFFAVTFAVDLLSAAARRSLR